MGQKAKKEEKKITTVTSLGYKSRVDFLNSKNVSREVFDALIKSPFWEIQKLALRHKECPLDIRDKFSKHEKWYKRFVAILNVNAPIEYWKKAYDDESSHIQRYLSNYNIAFFERQDREKRNKLFSEKLKKLVKE